MAELIPLDLWYTDRSRYETGTGHCQRARYLQYHAGPHGYGWAPRASSVPLVTGIMLAEIQEQYSNDTIRVSVEGGVAAIGDLPGVERVHDLGQVQELRMRRGSDPQEVLRTLMSRARVSSFAVTRPSLHDIFVRIAGPAAEEKGAAAHA